MYNSGAVPRPTSIYLGRSPELAARVRNLLDDLQQYTRGKRRCEELRRQLRRSLTRAKQELRRLLAERGAVWTWYERRPRAPGKKPDGPSVTRATISSKWS